VYGAWLIPSSANCRFLFWDVTFSVVGKDMDRTSPWFRFFSRTGPFKACMELNLLEAGSSSRSAVLKDFPSSSSVVNKVKAETNESSHSRGHGRRWGVIIDYRSGLGASERLHWMRIPKKPSSQVPKCHVNQWLITTFVTVPDVANPREKAEVGVHRSWGRMT